MRPWLQKLGLLLILTAAPFGLSAKGGHSYSGHSSGGGHSHGGGGHGSGGGHSPGGGHSYGGGHSHGGGHSGGSHPSGKHSSPDTHGGHGSPHTPAPKAPSAKAPHFRPHAGVPNATPHAGGAGKSHEYASPGVARNSEGRIKRSEEAKHDFLKAHGYSKVPKGYQVDHIVPLYAGGKDVPSNMQLLTVAEHQAKTKADLKNYPHSRHAGHP